MAGAVVDASLAGAWLLPDEHSKEADALLKRITSGEVELVVPDLWIYEMTNLLIMAERRNRIGSDQIEEGLDLISSIPRTMHHHRSHLAWKRITRFASRFSLSAYDAAYLELSDRLQCPLHSSDESLRSAAGRLGLD